MMKRSKNIEQRQQSAIQEKSKLLKNIESAERLQIHQLDFHKQELVELEHVSISYGSNTVCKNVSITVENGGRICQCGKQIQRGDSCCRECFATWKPPSEHGRGKDKIDRVETTQVNIGESRDDEMAFYHGLISAHAIEGLLKWKNQTTVYIKFADQSRMSWILLTLMIEIVS